ncbi:peritrophin-44-like isoform X2 [Phlebotomus argentipes]|uniref:peritrophin-44-like isoform X2 n=1 Tax=Phlebotomus argentipes TaxID=94469 RepID=UPI0028938165|nr:peritrophin-44-like isoform X2 [Phlebotomus argentipes]
MKNILLVLAICLVGFTSANDVVCVGQADDSFVADPTSCYGYYLCRGEVGLPGTCPYDLWFDPVNIWCTYPGDFCSESPCAGVADGTFVDNPSSCGAWYYCSAGVGHPGVCSDDLYFNPENQTCTYPEYVDCTSGPTDPAPPVDPEVPAVASPYADAVPAPPVA